MPRPVEDRSDVGGAAQFNDIGPVPLVGPSRPLPPAAPVSAPKYVLPSAFPRASPRFDWSSMVTSLTLENDCDRAGRSPTVWWVETGSMCQAGDAQAIAEAGRKEHGACRGLEEVFDGRGWSRCRGGAAARARPDVKFVKYFLRKGRWLRERDQGSAKIGLMARAHDGPEFAKGEISLASRPIVGWAGSCPTSHGSSQSTKGEPSSRPCHGRRRPSSQFETRRNSSASFAAWPLQTHTG